MSTLEFSQLLGNYGEFIGAIAILVTLIYLAVQLRQNTHAQSIATFERAMSGYNNLLEFWGGDSTRASILRRGMLDPDKLDEEERTHLDIMIRHYANHIYMLFRLYERGVFPKEEWENSIHEAKLLFETTGFSYFVKNNHYFDDLWVEMNKYPLVEITDLSRLKNRE